MVELEPLKFTLPDYPFVGALLLTLRDEQNRRFAANFVNVVVKPDRPLPRIQRRGPKEVVVRFAPGDFARQQWSDPAKAPPGKVYGRGKGYFEYRLELPASVAKAHPESFYYLFQAGSKAKRERVDWPAASQPPGLPPDGHGAHLAVHAGPVRQRTARRPDHVARRLRLTRGVCSHTWPASSTAATASSSMGW